MNAAKKREREKELEGGGERGRGVEVGGGEERWEEGRGGEVRGGKVREVVCILLSSIFASCSAFAYATPPAASITAFFTSRFNCKNNPGRKISMGTRSREKETKGGRERMRYILFSSNWQMNLAMSNR